MASIWPSAETLAKRSYDWALVQWRDRSPAGRAVARKRADCDWMLDALARSAPRRFQGTVLVDGMWDNPNYWLRYSMLRAALGLAHGREVGLVGPFRQNHCRGTFERLGIRTVESLMDLPVPRDVDRLASELAAGLQRPEDILEWTLPYGVSPTILYDGILKRQRLAAVDIRHPKLESHIAEGLRAIEQARYLLDTHDPDIVVVSHPFNFAWGSLAWQAISRGVPVVVLWAFYGTLRFTRLDSHETLFRFYDRPSGKDIDALPPARAQALAAIGRQYLEGRFGGRADDLQAVYAFNRATQRVDRAKLCQRFGWDINKPIVGFYASNWYDWPHQLGMTQFRDFLDWTEATVAVAHRYDGVNWLLKPHPCEDWFGGIGLAEILSDRGAPVHVAISDKRWSNAEVMQAIDALVTYHGTAGIEFASMGKPVLIPDRGKYDDCGFAKVARSREHYLELLASEWWTDIDLAETRLRAEIFSGWWMCAPDWQGDFLFRDDSLQDRLYDIIPGLVSGSKAIVEKELETLRAWWDAAHPYYQTFKMQRADRYRLSNVA
jgi:hypothetical protein